MISKCANPVCSTAFRYMRDGKLFRMEFDPELESLMPHLADESRRVRRVEHFWLCGTCSASLTLVMKDGQVMTAPIDSPAFRQAAAS